jgi:hypothetical protein
MISPRVRTVSGPVQVAVDELVQNYLLEKGKGSLPPHVRLHRNGKGAHHNPVSDLTVRVNSYLQGQVHVREGMTHEAMTASLRRLGYNHNIINGNYDAPYSFVLEGHNCIDSKFRC